MANRELKKVVAIAVFAGVVAALPGPARGEAEELSGLDTLRQQLNAVEAIVADASESQTIKGVRSNLQAALNYLEGSRGVRFDGNYRGPEGGRGVLDAIDDALEELEEAVDAAGSGEGAVAPADHVRKVLMNVRRWSMDAAIHAGYGIDAPRIRGMKFHVIHVAKRVQYAMVGREKNFDGRLEWEEGGLSMALDEARRLEELSTSRRGDEGR